MISSKLIGWLSFILALLLCCFWAFWGIIENFHEGWYHQSIGQNLKLMLVQYLAPLIISLMLSLLSIWKNRLGSILFVSIGIALAFFMNNPIAFVPFLILGALIWFSDFSPRKWKYHMLYILPICCLVAFGTEPIMRVSSRLQGLNENALKVEQNGVSIIWAPQGPGWPIDGLNWYEADSICRHLTEDGLSLSTVPQNIWRLPSLDEAVKSMLRHGENAYGSLNDDGMPVYSIKPDKEPPLWHPYSKVIYWWTATETEGNRALIIVYDGKSWERKKDFGPNYLGFRAVKDFQADSSKHQTN